MRNITLLFAKFCHIHYRYGYQTNVSSRPIAAVFSFKLLIDFSYFMFILIFSGALVIK